MTGPYTFLQISAELKMSISPLITTDTFLDLLRQCVEKMILHKEEVFPKKATLAQLEWKAI